MAAEAAGAEAQAALLERLRRREEEKAHARTKDLLTKESEKLDFALGEVEVLSRQLKREKEIFEKTLDSMKRKALEELTQKDKLINKCNEIKSRIVKQEDVLKDKENEIQALQRCVAQQKQTLECVSCQWVVGSLMLQPAAVCPGCQSSCTRLYSLFGPCFNSMPRKDPSVRVKDTEAARIVHSTSAGEEAEERFQVITQEVNLNLHSLKYMHPLSGRQGL
ncbi:spermatogenesis-associated protein 24 isoform X2 [Struthio camelus]|uniref:spermatogenesis-associated protein 24 isoform X2 n=1 Tax=Struthio camelus TaxID=8801 RepID=UPI0036042F6A